MKGYCKDYKVLCQQTGEFYKKHWKGTILLNVVLIVAELSWFFRNQIKDKIEEKVNKGDEAQ